MTASNQMTNQDNPQPPRVQPRRRITADSAGPKSEKIRAELNIEKWPAIWNPTHSKNHSKLRTQSRTMERETTGPDGTKTLSKVTVNPIAQLGDLTTDDQRTLYALIKHWEERGKPEHETPFSIRHVAKLLHRKGWGTNVIDSITGSLERLRGTMLMWTRSYRSKDQRVENLETVYINILSKLKIVRRKVDGHVTTEAGYFQFDDNILKNLLNNYTKPFLFDVFIDIRGEIALKLYSYIDLIMADKNRFERCTRELFEDLGLKGESYRNPSKRKQNLEKAFVELTGIMLTTGVLKSASIEKTKDGKDYKAVFQKTPRSEITALESESLTTFVSADRVVINDYSKIKDPLRQQAEQIVSFFHKTVHGVENHSPQSKEIDQASSLISQYGADKAKHVIEYAAAKAVETNFKIQHFGAILSYTSRALAVFDRQQAVGEQTVPAERRPIQHERKTWKRGEARLAVLSPEQYEARFESCKTDLFQERPQVVQYLKAGSKLYESTIRARLVQELENEAMDLVSFDAELTAMYPWYSGTQNLPLPATENSGLVNSSSEQVTV